MLDAASSLGMLYPHDSFDNEISEKVLAPVDLFIRRTSPRGPRPRSDLSPPPPLIAGCRRSLLVSNWHQSNFSTGPSCATTVFSIRSRTSRTLMSVSRR
jgi:hypothetical protein